MKIGNSPVKTEGSVIGEVDYPIFETLNEALTHTTHGVGEAKALELINVQVKTNAMNAFRQMKTKGPTKTQLRTDAMTEIVAEVSAGNHQDCIGNRDALENLINRRMAEIEARIKAAGGTISGGNESEAA